jgi:hypothetical protein
MTTDAAPIDLLITDLEMPEMEGDERRPSRGGGVAAVRPDHAVNHATHHRS